MPASVSPALRVLLNRVIDYAGMFPPATLSREVAVANFESYQQSEHAWMLRSLVINSAELERVPSHLDGSLAVLSDADEPRAALIETKRVIKPLRPTYCEVGSTELDEVQRAGCFAKLRTGGLKPEAIPAVEDVASFIIACAERKLPFKATAGLHHSIRAVYALTYEPDAPSAVMHGFLNVFMAAAFAWHGVRDIGTILRETDVKAFRFDQCAHWREHSLDVEQIRDARKNFIHSFGSCSFEEPVADLQALGLL